MAGGVGRRKRDTTTSLKVTWDPGNRTISAEMPGDKKAYIVLFMKPDCRSSTALEDFKIITTVPSGILDEDFADSAAVGIALAHQAWTATTNGNATKEFQVENVLIMKTNL